MKPGWQATKIISAVGILVFVIPLVYYLTTNHVAKRKRFEKQIKRGAPIVEAIYRFKDQAGHYPAALNSLVPRYVEDVSGWDYHLKTNGASVSFTLYHYMVRHAVEYEPPCWYTINENGWRSEFRKTR